MLLVILFWLALFLVVMRLLTWVARRYPGARNGAALLVESLAALAFRQTVVSTGVAYSGLTGVPWRWLERALWFAVIAVLFHYFANKTATSPHALYPPFLAVGVLAIVQSGVGWRAWPVAVVMVLAGLIVAWLKLRSIRASGPPARAPLIREA